MNEYAGIPIQCFMEAVSQQYVAKHMTLLCVEDIIR